MPAPTVYDVADRAGVSIATVSRVFRNPSAVRASTREKVQEAARTLGYVPSGAARGLASRSTGVLGLCFPDEQEPDAAEVLGATANSADTADTADQALYSDEVIRGMERAARRGGFGLLISASMEGGGEHLVQRVAGHVDGLAVLSTTVPDDILDTLGRRLPVVMLAGHREFDHLDHLSVDNAYGQREVTRHLIETHSIREFAVVGGPKDSPDPASRWDGHREALAAAGLEVPDGPDVRGHLTQRGGRAAVVELLARGPLPRGLVFANDQMAVGGLRELAEAGVDVPGEVAVTGFDDIPLARQVRPSLTTVRQPMRELGAVAVEMLMRRLANLDMPPVSRVLPVTPVLRESCGC